MALPAIGLASGLSTLLGGLMAALVGFFSAVVTKKAATALALGAFLVTGWVALQAAILALWSALAFALPPSLAVPLAFVVALLPSNTSACVQALVLAKIARWLWDNQASWARAVAGA